MKSVPLTGGRICQETAARHFHIRSPDERFTRTGSRSRTASPTTVFTGKHGCLFPAPWHRRIWRADRAGGVHAAGPGRKAWLDNTGAIPRWTGAGAACARSAGRTVGDLSRIRALGNCRRERRGFCVYRTVVPDGDCAGHGIRTLRRAVVLPRR